MASESVVPEYHQVICHVSPEGFWYKDERGKGTWIGPFETQEKTEEIALQLIPDHQNVLTILDLQAKTTIRVPVKTARSRRKK